MIGIFNKLNGVQAADSINRELQLLLDVCYIKMRLEEIDFSSFSLEEAIDAYGEIDGFMVEEDEDEENRGNLLLEVNRCAHIAIKVKAINAHKKPKKFF